MEKNNYILTDSIIFDSKPDAVPYQYRLSYKVSLSCLILGLNCGRSGCSLTKLHIITVSMYSKKEKQNLLDYVENKQNTFLTLRYEPAVNKTIEYMLADEIIYQQLNGLYRLTKSGKEFYKKIMNQKSLLKEEKKYLKNLSNSLTEELIEKVKKSLLG